MCVRRSGQRRAKLDRHDFTGIFLGYSATDQNIIYLDLDSGIVKTSHHAQFDEAWYLQQTRPPAVQLLYDIRLEYTDVDTADMPLNTLSENPSCSLPWPPIYKGASNTPKLEVPPSCLITPLPLQETATPRPLTAAAALLQASDQLDETVLECFNVQHMAHSNSGPKLCAALLPRPQHAIAARTLATNPSDIVSVFLLGKNDMATIYLLPNPYFDAFEEVIDIRRFDKDKHGTAGLCLTADDGDRVFLGGITPSTPAAKIPH